MILGSEIEGFIIINSLGEEIGKIKDVIVDTTKKDWYIKEIIITKGIIKGKGTFPVNAIKNFDESEEKILLKEGIDVKEFDEKKFSHEYISMDNVKDRDIFGSDEEEIGKIYDYVIATELSPWQVTKLLIRPHEERLKGRRIRLDVENVTQITDLITVKYSKEELEKKAEA